MKPEKMVDIITSYGDGLEKIIRETGLSQEEIEEIVLDEGNIEKCPNCGWYQPAYELIPDDEDEPDGLCENCR